MAQEEKAYRIGKQVLHEADLEFEVEYEGETFTLRYPNLLVRNAIEVEIARRLGNTPRAALPAEHVGLIEAACYVAALVELKKCPDWYKGPWDTIDDALTWKLYYGYLSFREELSDRPRKAGTGSPGKGDGT